MRVVQFEFEKLAEEKISNYLKQKRTAARKKNNQVVIRQRITTNEFKWHFCRKTKETVNLEARSEQTHTVAWSSWGLWKSHRIGSYRKPSPGKCLVLGWVLGVGKVWPEDQLAPRLEPCTALPPQPACDWVCPGCVSAPEGMGRVWGMDA